MLNNQETALWIQNLVPFPQQQSNPHKLSRLTVKLMCCLVTAKRLGMITPLIVPRLEARNLSF